MAKYIILPKDGGDKMDMHADYFWQEENMACFHQRNDKKIRRIPLQHIWQVITEYGDDEEPQ